MSKIINQVASIQKIILTDEKTASDYCNLTDEERKKYLMVGDVYIKLGSTLEEFHEIIAAI